jgi:hypothetical protein
VQALALCLGEHLGLSLVSSHLGKFQPITQGLGNSCVNFGARHL